MNIFSTTVFHSRSSSDGTTIPGDFDDPNVHALLIYRTRPLS